MNFAGKGWEKGIPGSWDRNSKVSEARRGCVWVNCETFWVVYTVQAYIAQQVGRKECGKKVRHQLWERWLEGWGGGWIDGEEEDPRAATNLLLRKMLTHRKMGQCRRLGDLCSHAQICKNLQFQVYFEQQAPTHEIKISQIPAPLDHFSSLTTRLSAVQAFP